MKWPFDQPPNCATMTDARVMRDGAFITRVYHDEADDGWQFFSEHPFMSKDALIVALKEIVKLDPTVTEVADLPPGWMARRKFYGMPWRRTLQYADAPRIIVDWSKITGENDFYDTVFAQCGSPGWHGRNLNALADSWVTGGINRHSPPYAFGFFSPEGVPPALVPFRVAVLKIAQESIDENGGRYMQPDEYDGGKQPLPQ